jgi:hypothetical protein
MEPDKPSKHLSKRQTLALGCAAVACALILGAVAGYGKLHLVLMDIDCATHIRYGVGFTLAAYASDHDDTYPGDKWMDAISPYRSDGGRDSDFRCPALTSANAGAYGYALNVRLAGKKADTNEEIPLVFESTLLGRSVISGLQTFPRVGRHQGKSYAYYENGDLRAVPDGKTP